MITKKNSTPVPVGEVGVQQGVLKVYQQILNSPDLKGIWYNPVSESIFREKRLSKTTQEWDINFLPKDKVCYELICRIEAIIPVGHNTGSFLGLILYSDMDYGSMVIEGGSLSPNVASYLSSNFTIIVGLDRKIKTYLWESSITTASFGLNCYGYRRVDAILYPEAGQ